VQNGEIQCGSKAFVQTNAGGGDEINEESDSRFWHLGGCAI
jgi:hypothetical protein